MFKKNTRKRLLAGALATVMMLTMCPSWALADVEDGIAPLPANEEIAVPVDDSTPAADPTETPAVPTPSETENQNTAPAPSDDGANGGTDSTESGNSTNPTISEGSENNSQKNNVVSSSPDVNDQPQDAANEANSFIDGLDLTMEASMTKKREAEMWITNRHAADKKGKYTFTIRSDIEKIDTEEGVSVASLVEETREAYADNNKYNTVFWQARVHHGLLHHQGTGSNDDKTQLGTEITHIRYKDGKFEYLAKGSDEWTKFALATDQLVFYYLIRTEYSDMVQIDVSDWTVDKEDTHYSDRRSVTYQVIVDGGVHNGKVLASRKFWYNKAFTVSSVRVREIGNDPNYSIDRVALEPDNLGKVNETNKEFQFSLDLTQIEPKQNATVKIYVKPNVDPHQLTYDKDGGEFTSSGYTEGSVYPKQTIIVPEVEKENYIFDGWFDEKTGTKYETGDPMPNNDLTLTAHWTANPPVTPPTQPETKLTDAKYFVLLPTRGTPQSGASQGWTSYLPNDGSDGGVKGLTHDTGYKGFLKPEGQRMADEHRTGDDSNGIYNVNGFGDDYLVPPTDLGFFTESNWSPDGTLYNSNKESNTTDPSSVLGTNFNVKNNIRVVWYTIKYQADEQSYHVDGYVKNVAINVTYHSNFGEGKTYNHPTRTGTDYEARSYTETGLPTRANYTFGGWCTDIACTEPYTQQVLRTSLDLYAKWVPTVSYFVDNVQYGDIDTYAFNSDVVIRPVPTKEGYTFHGWTPADDVANIIKIDDKGHFTMPAQPVLFNGTFEINHYNVIYKVDNEVVYTDVYDFNHDVTIRPVPTKDGYTFSGWKIGTADAENFKMPAHDVTIEGTFAKNSSGGHHHRRPTVTIPDEVPTGLNGNDHYAYIVGYPDKTVRPQNGITRAEVATIFFRLLTDETRDANSTKSNSYSDVAAGAWYNHAVSTLSAMGIVKGSNGKFNPNAPITRAEFAAIAARFDDKANTTTADFSDIASHWAKNEISAASNNGWINGYPDGTFRPDNKITRAEAMTLVNRVLKRLPETEEDLHDDMIKWSDNSDASQWFYLAVQEATNSHYYQTKENQFEKWTELRETRDWTELEK